MRPLKITPVHAITELALSPDGQRLGVVQGEHGFRLLDAVTGAELGHDIQRLNVSEWSPTGRCSLHAQRTAIRLAEVAAGKPFLLFQTGWTRVGDRNLPPAVPATSALSSSAVVSWPTFTRRGSAVSPAGWHSLSGAALTADHRFVVGQYSHASRYAVRDLASERIVTTLALSAAHTGTSGARTIFTPDERRIVAATSRHIAVFDLPPPEPLTRSPLSAFNTLVTQSKPVALTPATSVPVTQPQPVPGVPPFAVLPCGKKILVRGEKSRVELHDLTTGAVLTTWKWRLQRLYALAVAADGLTAAAGGAGGQVVIWDLE